MKERTVTELSAVVASLESRAAQRAMNSIYLVLTNTKTVFARISQAVTRDPYNHISVALDRKLDTLYTYALINETNGRLGGFKIENRNILNGAEYALYSVDVTKKQLAKIKKRLKELATSREQTRYNHIALLNAVIGKPLFESRGDRQLICSEFAAGLLETVGVSLFEDRDPRVLRPQEFSESKVVKFIEEGVISAESVILPVSVEW